MYSFYLFLIIFEYQGYEPLKKNDNRFLYLDVWMKIKLCDCSFKEPTLTYKVYDHHMELNQTHTHDKTFNNYE